MADRVQFLGSVDERALRAAYESCDVFVLPSAGEGFGIVFLEAMHYRKPIIAANSGATPEVVKDGETGMLVEAGNVEQLAAAMIALGTNQPERDRMGAAGYKRLQENFTFDHFKRRLHEIVFGRVTKESFRSWRASNRSPGKQLNLRVVFSSFVFWSHPPRKKKNPTKKKKKKKKNFFFFFCIVYLL